MFPENSVTWDLFQQSIFPWITFYIWWQYQFIFRHFCRAQWLIQNISHEMTTMLPRHVLNIASIRLSGIRGGGGGGGVLKIQSRGTYFSKAFPIGTHFIFDENTSLFSVSSIEHSDWYKIFYMTWQLYVTVPCAKYRFDLNGGNYFPIKQFCDWKYNFHLWKLNIGSDNSLVASVMGMGTACSNTYQKWMLYGCLLPLYSIFTLKLCTWLKLFYVKSRWLRLYHM